MRYVKRWEKKNNQEAAVTQVHKTWLKSLEEKNPVTFTVFKENENYLTSTFFK